ncbi:enoyl-CoA hydratase [Rhodococcus rhodnii]|uniref:Uncharacterized protein n=2 Tax=Rhodococcus rhodnii TaxID=38312 RepID=R7WQA4_9NOCA|nr:MaoC/PaaZ C-terminal domain-containing protein [Rhodococcus rhodnii]EOM77502.1 hypothetical protein Rrhod_1179 [Rhodococcus rhodnii LMG 5362]TXG90370.1 enoyl-CoA hydratase [Rhodococcus rhodnii]
MTRATTENPVRCAGDWEGVELGRRTVAYDESAAILYALAVGARATELDLVLENRLRVLPTFALTLAQWAPDQLGSRGAFDTATALHGSQRLDVLAPLPPRGELDLHARVANVWDKGGAAVFDVRVESRCFEATWSIFAPGAGGFGGERGPAKPKPIEREPDVEATTATSPDQAALYRLTGDRHLIHIDPEAAAHIGQPRPIMHGLCSLAASALGLARAVGAHPADLTALEGRFAAPVFPGQDLQVRAWHEGDGHVFDVAADGATAIAGGSASFTGAS